MSASLLNVAALPGSAGQPGATTGIAQQATQAAQAHGPMAGFEALLAAFFGDQMAATPGLAGQIQAPFGQFVAQAAQAAQGAKADGKAAKSADAADGGKSSDAQGGVADAAVDAALDAAALAMITSGPAAQVQLQAAGAGNADETTPDAGLAGKPASQATLAQLAAAALSADSKTSAAKIADAGQAADAAPSAQAAIDPKAAQANAPALPIETPPLSAQPAAVAAQTLQPPGQPVAAVQAKPPEPTETKDKGQAIKSVRVEGAPTSAAPAVAAKTTADIVQAAADGAGKDASTNERDPNAGSRPDSKSQGGDAGQPAAAFNVQANAQANNPAALAHAEALVRGAPQTVANLAAQIAKKLDGRASRFDVQLEPAGLGKVDVRVEIDAAGKMSAALAFDNQQAASELKSRAGELQRALEQAGFDLSGGLSFELASQDGQGQNTAQDNSTPTFRGRASQAVLDGGADSAVAPPTTYGSASTAGLDIRI